jgi:hypothetical protein
MKLARRWRDFPTQKLWVSGYLEPTLASTWYSLKPGAQLALNVSSRLRELVMTTCLKAGFTFQKEISFLRKRDHFSHDKSNFKEPVLIFKKCI